MDDLIAGISNIGLNSPPQLYIAHRPDKCVCTWSQIPAGTLLGYIEGNQYCTWEIENAASEGHLIIDDNYTIYAPGNILAYIREGSLLGLVRNCILFVDGGPGTERIGMKTIEDIPAGAELSYYAGIIDL